MILNKQHSLQHVAALTIAALALYIPANLYPIITMQYMGLYKETTIYEGVQSLFDEGMWFTGTIVFLASIVIPLIKIFGLLFLVIMASIKKKYALVFNFHRLIDNIGRWSMLDVFLLSIMVALVKFGSFATVTSGVGSVAFAAVVLFTMLASMMFDRNVLREGQNE
ncbi:paraquat-inducible protein A [Rickettsiales bacterium]|nr:paraquat-inducible protein A [Rickettsiales bacterium]